MPKKSKRKTLQSAKITTLPKSYLIYWTFICPLFRLLKFLLQLLLQSVCRYRKMITGILRPTSGSIEFDGHAWKRSDLNHIGALIEMPPLYENLTAYENLKVRTTILGLTDKRIDEVLQIVRLTETGKKKPDSFLLV